MISFSNSVGYLINNKRNFKALYKDSLLKKKLISKYMLNFISILNIFNNSDKLSMMKNLAHILWNRIKYF